MAGQNDKKRMLDDEMSRFEAEISGPTAMDSDQTDLDMDVRPIIGSNTFAQVKEKLRKDIDEDELAPPPPPPSFNNASKSRFGSSFGAQNHPEPHTRDRSSTGPPELGPLAMPGPPSASRMLRSSGPQRMSCPGIQRVQGFSPQGSNPFGPRPPPHGFNQRQFRPGPRNFCQNMVPGNESPANSFPPPPPPPGFMGHHGRGGGANNFHPPGMAPPPPGFVPPQVNRMTNMGPVLNNGSHMGPSMGPRSHASLLRPPPPPPGLLGQRMASNGPLRPPSTVTKPSAVISSAPKLYLVQANQNENAEGVTHTPAPTLEIKNPNPPSDKNSKKKKTKFEQKTSMNSQSRIEGSHAVEMAEKVKQSVTTSKQNVHSVQQNLGANGPPEERKKEKRSKKNLRYAGGQIWEDTNLAEWDPDDFRMFAGDLGNDVTDELLHRYFSHYSSFARAKVVRDKRTNKSKGYGFISFKDSQDYIRAMKEMNGKYLGSRPIKLRKSMWRDRNLDVVQKKLKEKQLSGLK